MVLLWVLNINFQTLCPFKLSLLFLSSLVWSEFEYNPQFHNVMRVTHAMYKACNASLPLESFTTGNDTVKIARRGHHFFLCGVPGHCQVGQKVDINVPRKSSSVEAGAPSPSVFVSPSVPIAAKTPSPSANSAEPLQRSYVLLVLLALVALVFGSYTLVWFVGLK